MHGSVFSLINYIYKTNEYDKICYISLRLTYQQSKLIFSDILFSKYIEILRQNNWIVTINSNETLKCKKLYLLSFFF